MKAIDVILETDSFTPAAHRGASMEHAQNTIPAFQRALEILPQCLIETDAHVTQDGAVVLLHDDDCSKQTDGIGAVSEKTLDEIKMMDGGYNITFDGGRTYPFRKKGYKVPTLNEALNKFPSAIFSIDIKDNHSEAVQKVAAVLDEENARERVILGTFHDKVMKALRRDFPYLVTSFSTWETIRFLLLNKIGPSCIVKPKGRSLFVPEYYFRKSSEYIEEKRCNGLSIINKKLIKISHEMDLTVFAWTINRKENMKRLIEWGVNGIVSDCPDLLREVMIEEKIIGR